MKRYRLRRLTHVPAAYRSRMPGVYTPGLGDLEGFGSKFKKLRRRVVSIVKKPLAIVAAPIMLLPLAGKAAMGLVGKAMTKPSGGVAEGGEIGVEQPPAQSSPGFQIPFNTDKAAGFTSQFDSFAAGAQPAVEPMAPDTTEAYDDLPTATSHLSPVKIAVVVGVGAIGGLLLWKLMKRK